MNEMPKKSNKFLIKLFILQCDCDIIPFVVEKRLLPVQQNGSGNWSGILNL